MTVAFHDVVPGIPDAESLCALLPALVVSYDGVADNRGLFGQVGGCVELGVVSVKGPRHHHRSNNPGGIVENSSY